MPRPNDELAARQLAQLRGLEGRPTADLSPPDLETIFAAAARPGSDEVQLRAAVLLSQIYPELAPTNPDFARRTHVILLRDLREPRATLAHPSCSWLVMTHLRAENLEHIPWQSAAEVAAAAECFYGFCCDDGALTSEESHRRVRDLVKYAAYHFVSNGRWAEAFRLFEQVQVPASVMDADLFRMRSTLVLYEQKRARRVRRALWLWMAFAAAFIVGVAPMLFLMYEGADRVDHGQPPLTLGDATYWSVITAATVGCGDIVPHTAVGRGLALVNCLLGVAFTGVIAGLLLHKVTARSLP